MPRPLITVADPGRPRLAARTRIGGAHQLEPGRHRHVMIDPPNRHPARLERLPHGVKHRRSELAHLVEEQHTAMGERDLAGANHVGTPTHQRRRRRGVMRGPERRPGDQT